MCSGFRSGWLAGHSSHCSFELSVGAEQWINSPVSALWSWTFLQFLFISLLLLLRGLAYSMMLPSPCSTVVSVESQVTSSVRCSQDVMLVLPLDQRTFVLLLSEFFKYHLSNSTQAGMFSLKQFSPNHFKKDWLIKCCWDLLIWQMSSSLQKTSSSVTFWFFVTSLITQSDCN